MKKNLNNFVESSRGFLAKSYMTLVYVTLFAVVIVLSLFNIKFDFEQIKTGSFWGNLCINYALAVVSMIFAMFDGEKKRKQSETYIRCLKDWTDKKHLILDTNLVTIFEEYLVHRHKKDQADFIKEVMSSHCIKQEWLDMDFEQLKKCRKEVECSPDQLAIVRKLKKGKYTIKKIRTVDIMNSTKKSDLRFEYNISVDRTQFIADTVLPKLVFMFITTSLLVSVVFDVINSNTGQAVANLVMRLFNVAISLTTGYRGGFHLADEQIEAYNNRGLIMDDFQSELVLGVFTPSVQIPIEPVKKEEDRAPIEDIDEENDDDWEVVEMTKEEVAKLDHNKNKNPK